MAGEKAKENKTLQSACAGCGDEMSVELLRGVTVGSGRSRRIVAVCKSCLDKGWDPQSPPPQSATDGAAAS
jgi:hypothetical protein